MKKSIVFSILLAMSPIAGADIVEDVRNAALDTTRPVVEGQIHPQCLEAITAALIKQRGLGQASNIVAAAYLVLGELAEQQKSLGCTGTIGQAAIVAGADPGEILEATAAGEGTGRLSAPAGLGDPGVIGATGLPISPS